MAQPHEITFADGTVGAFVELHEHNATIYRLTAERDQARAEAAAAYERAARVADGEVSRRSDQLQWPNHGEIQINRWQAGKLEAELISNKIRALATEAETDALAELLDAETRACAEVVRSAIPNIPPDGPTNDECRIVYEELGGAMTAILARLGQRKEAGA